MYVESPQASVPVSGDLCPTVLIGDQHPAFASAMAHLFRSKWPGCTIMQTASYDELENWCAEHTNAVILVNPRMSEAPGLRTIALLRATGNPKQLFILLDEENSGLASFFEGQGATAVLPKTADFTTIDRLLNGERIQPETVTASDTIAALGCEFYNGLANLTKRQATILGYLKRGKLNKQIAHDLGISEATVKHHVSALLSALGFYSRSQLVAMINELGLCVDSQYARQRADKRKRAVSRRAAHHRLVRQKQALDNATTHDLRANLAAVG
ncbi:response regulator transcription factor [Polycladidibacter hongkongensis]|uniref:response regulator transcription factor n=1 Tax=Polycladidibacter hongkongensis TaxID=1647556 RepID=UPI00082A5743|nr:response regulator transcription factor [Pseudovibrio hongkongensis]